MVANRSPKSEALGSIMVSRVSHLWQVSEYTPWQHAHVVQPPEFNREHPFHQVTRDFIAVSKPGIWDQPTMPMAQAKLALPIESQRDWRGVVLPIKLQECLSGIG